MKSGALMSIGSSMNTRNMRKHASAPQGAIGRYFSSSADKPQEVFLNNRGMGRAAIVFILAIAGAVVYSGFKIFPFFYYAEEIEGVMASQAAKATVFSDEQIRRVVWERVKELEIPVDDRDQIQINRFDGKIVIELRYEEVFFIELGDRVYDIYTFEFNPRAEREL